MSSGPPKKLQVTSWATVPFQISNSPVRITQKGKRFRTETRGTVCKGLHTNFAWFGPISSLNDRVLDQITNHSSSFRGHVHGITFHEILNPAIYSLCFRHALCKPCPTSKSYNSRFLLNRLPFPTDYLSDKRNKFQANPTLNGDFETRSPHII